LVSASETRAVIQKASSKYLLKSALINFVVPGSV
jgi:hypothetical protein